MYTDHFPANNITTAIQSGNVPASELDGMVNRILTTMFQFGIFDNPPTGNLNSTVTNSTNIQFAQQRRRGGNGSVEKQRRIIAARFVRAFDCRHRFRGECGADFDGRRFGERESALQHYPAGGNHQPRRRRHHRQLRPGRRSKRVPGRATRHQFRCRYCVCGPADQRRFRSLQPFVTQRSGCPGERRCRCQPAYNRRGLCVFRHADALGQARSRRCWWRGIPDRKMATRWLKSCSGT